MAFKRKQNWREIPTYILSLAHIAKRQSRMPTDALSVVSRELQTIVPNKFYEIKLIKIWN